MDKYDERAEKIIDYLYFDGASGQSSTIKIKEFIVAILREALEDYGEHRTFCILSMASQGRPTTDGGYETMYNGKWYRETPKCECGFQAALDGGKL